MKHILSINELYRTTYISAADKLSHSGHRKRSKELLDWSDKRGINTKVDRIYPHMFHFNDNIRKESQIVHDTVISERINYAIEYLHEVHNNRLMEKVTNAKTSLSQNY